MQRARPPNTANWEATISVSGFGSDEGDDTGSDIWAVLNAPLVEGRLGLRAYVSHYDDPGYIDYLYVLRDPGFSNPQPNFDDPADVDANLIRVDDANSGEIVATKAALLWEVSDAASATLSYYYQETDYGGRSINYRHAMVTGPYESAHRILEPSERKNQLVSLEIQADLGFAELVSATGVSDYDEFSQRDGTDLVLLLEDDLWAAFPNFVTISRDDID
jgi:iron complex outermembrane recepter protein